MNDTDLKVVSIHGPMALALLSNDTQVPVTSWFDDKGADCFWQKAVTCVCGKDGVGWFAIDLREFSPAKVH